MKNQLSIIKLTLFLLFANLQAFAQGDLMISPKRVVLEGRTMTEQLILINTGQDTAVYTVSFIENRALEYGGYEAIETPDPGQMFSSEHIRIFPRRFELAPNEPQTMRLQFVRKPGLEEGEYRSHLYFRMESADKIAQQARRQQDNTELEEGAIAIQLIPVYGFTIPIIARLGDTSFDLKIDDMSLIPENDDGNPVLNFTISRNGNQSVYGDIYVDYVLEGQEPVNVARARGLSIFTPNPHRKFRMDLRMEQGMDLMAGELHISYTEHSSARNRRIYASEIFVPGRMFVEQP